MSCTAGDSGTNWIIWIWCLWGVPQNVQCLVSASGVVCRGIWSKFPVVICRADVGVCSVQSFFQTEIQYIFRQWLLLPHAKNALDTRKWCTSQQQSFAVHQTAELGMDLLCPSCNPSHFLPADRVNHHEGAWLTITREHNFKRCFAGELMVFAVMGLCLICSAFICCRDPCPIGRAAEMPWPAVWASGPVTAGLAGFLPQESRDWDGLLQEFGEVGWEIPG